MKRVLVITAAILSFTLHGMAQKAAVFSTDGKAIRGYDPVAFFNEGKAVKGNDSLVYEWQGTNWYFSSKKNLNSFIAKPAAFAPQYGGYCAYGAAAGHKAPTETDTWIIVNDKLYFNSNGKVKEAWSKKQPELIKKADENWPALKDNE